jgi:hypothetical protein
MHCTGGLLKNKVLAFKTPGFPTVLRPRTYTNIIGFQLLSIPVTTVTKKATNQRPRTKGHEPKVKKRPRTYTNIIGFQLLSIPVTTVTKKATNQSNYTRTR